MGVRSAVGFALALAAAASHASDLSTPAATTEIDSSAIEGRRISGLDDIAEAVPAVSYTRASNSLTTLSLYMRGAGPVAPGQITLDGAVGVYQDGFYIPRAQANTFDLLDLERVEVLPGPQGAAYGRDTTGGVINLVSKAPSGSLAFNQDVDFGNRNSYKVLSSFDTPTWHGLAAKATLLASGIDGYVRNEYVKSNDYGAEKQRAGRLQLHWTGAAHLRADYFLERSSLDSTPEYESNPSQNGEEIFTGYTYYGSIRKVPTTTYRPIDLLLSTSNHTAHGLTLTWDAWRFLTVRSLTGYRTLAAYEEIDTAEFYGYPLATADLYQQHQLSEDLQLSGALFGGQLDYAVGGVYFKEKGAHDSLFDLLAAGESEEHTLSAQSRSEALYARIHWQPQLLGERLEATLAGRYTRDIKDAVRSVTVNVTDALETDARNHLSYGKATPEFDLVYHVTDGISTYAKVATAYEAGGALESAVVNDFHTESFKPESDTTYELGLKSILWRDRVHTNIALFDSRRKDVQYAVPLDILDDGIYTFQRVTVKGANLDVRAAPVNDLQVGVSAVYLDPRVDRADVLSGSLFDPASGYGAPYAVGQNIRSLFVLPYTPKYSGSITTDYALLHLFRRDLLLHLDYVYRARMFANAAAGSGVPGAAKFDAQSGYGLLNGHLTLRQESDWSHHLKFSLWGRNLLNRQYYQPAYGVGAGVSSFDTSGSTTTPGGYTARAGSWAEPRTYGLSVRFEY